MKTEKVFSPLFVMLAILFNVCLISSNLFACKLTCLFGRFTVSGADVIFPISYILNDCLAEVYGYRKARFVIWTGFAMNLFVVLTACLVNLMPAAHLWDGNAAFQYVFGAAPRSTIASLLAFLAGSTLNAFVLSKMKSESKGKHFALRAVASSLAGETLDSLIFVPIVFWSMGWKVIVMTMACEIVVKVGYEILILPLTGLVVKRLKKYEGTDTYDDGISYNPFKINDL